MTATKAEVHL